MVIFMKSIAKGMELTVSFNIGVKADEVYTHDKNVVNNTTTFDDKSFKGIDATANFNIKLNADHFDEDVDLKELGEVLTNLVHASVNEVKRQVEEQKETKVEKSEEVGELSAVETKEQTAEAYHDTVDGDEIANLMC